MNTSVPYQPEKEPYVFTMYEAVHVILEDISPKLIDYFNSKINPVSSMNILLQNHLKKWLKENQNTSLTDCYPNNLDITDPTLFNAIFCELSSILSQCSETDAYTKYKEISRGRKKYLYNQLREEVGELPLKPRNSLFIKNEWDALNNPYIVKNMAQISMNMDFASISGTFDDFSIQRFKAATSWYKQKDSFLLEFPYYEMLPESRKLSIYLIDLATNCLSLICKNYYRSKSGFVTRALDTRLGLDDTSIISWQSNALDLTYEVTDGMFQVYELESSSNSTRKIIIHEEPYNPALHGLEPEQLFAKIKSDINSGQQYRTIDTFDASIITAILNNFSVASLQDKSLHINLIELAYDVYGNTNIRAEKCERLIKHIIKLGRTRISNVSTTDKGVLLGARNISFFEYQFQVLTDYSLDNEHIITTINMASGDTKIDYSKLSMKDYSAMELVFYLSNYMYTIWNNNVHTYIRSTLYRQIESSKGRVLIQLLQEERLQIYPNLEVFIPYATFKNYLKITSKMDRFKKELSAELESLKGNAIAISDFEILSNGVRVVFHPLSVAEKTIYKL